MPCLRSARPSFAAATTGRSCSKSAMPVCRSDFRRRWSRCCLAARSASKTARFPSSHPRGERPPSCAPMNRFASSLRPRSAAACSWTTTWCTAGHCLRLFALEDFVVVFGYAYAAEGELSLGGDDVFQPTEIVDEALDPPATAARDFGFVRLDRNVSAPRAPVPVLTSAATLQPGLPLVAMSACGGTPLKVDAGGSLLSVDPGEVFFSADTDTNHGERRTARRSRHGCWGRRAVHAGERGASQRSVSTYRMQLPSALARRRQAV
jgi:hypothetical protein